MVGVYFLCHDGRFNPHRCSKKMRVDWENISNCAKVRFLVGLKNLLQGDEGKLLHSLAGEKTHALR